jgi:hypothetical protein
VVVGHRLLELSAMSAEEATLWNGRTFRYGPSLALWGADSCRAPSFRTETAATDSFLAIGFNMNAADLGVNPANLPRIRITEILCAGQEWTGPGGLLLWTGTDRAYTPWDGVFFELERRPTNAAAR